MRISLLFAMFSSTQVFLTRTALSRTPCRVTSFLGIHRPLTTIKGGKSKKEEGSNNGVGRMTFLTGRESSSSVAFDRNKVINKMMLGSGYGQSNRTIVFIRHGETDFNKFEIFTGWCDVDINDKGVEECRKAGYILASHGFEFDVAYTSVMKRATKSLWNLLDALDQTYVPIQQDWRLNERHYGSLQGLSKNESEKRLGPIVKDWRRGWSAKPPDMEPDHPHWPVISSDRRYQKIPDIPKAESLEMCSVRVKEYWDDLIFKSVKDGKKTIVMAHANSLRSLIKKLDDITDENIRAIKIPNAAPFVYRFDDAGNIVGEPDEYGFRGKFIHDKDDSCLEAYQEQARKCDELFMANPAVIPDECFIQIPKDCKIDF